MAWSPISDRVLRRRSIPSARGIGLGQALGRVHGRNDPAVVLLAWSNIAGMGSEGKDFSLWRLIWRPKFRNTNGLGVRVVAGRNLQCVIFAAFCAY